MAGFGLMIVVTKGHVRQCAHLGTLTVKQLCCDRSCFVNVAERLTCQHTPDMFPVKHFLCPEILFLVSVS
jgi:hypothetical protein